MLKASEHKKLWRLQIRNPPIIKIDLKLDQHLLLNIPERRDIYSCPSPWERGANFYRGGQQIFFDKPIKKKLTLKPPIEKY